MKVEGNEQEMTDKEEFDAAFDEDETESQNLDTDKADDDGEDDSLIEDNAPEGEAGELDADDDAEPYGEGDADTSDGDDGDMGEQADDELSDVPDEDKPKFKSWNGRLKAREAQLAERERAIAERERKLESEAPNQGDAGSQGEAEDEMQDAINEDDDLQEFLSEYPEFATPVQKMIAKAVKDVMGSVDERITPIVSQRQQEEMDAHVNAVLNTHPDLPELVESNVVADWIETQPYADAVELKRIYESGTSDEVIDLFTRYKNAASEQAHATKRQKQERQKRAATLPKSHPSRVTNLRGNADPNDFDAGWDEAD